MVHKSIYNDLRKIYRYSCPEEHNLNSMMFTTNLSPSSGNVARLFYWCLHYVTLLIKRKGVEANVDK